MKSYSQEFQDRVINEVHEYGDISAVARKHELPLSTVHIWVNRSKNKEKLSKDKELKRLKAELEDAKLENSILSDAAIRNCSRSETNFSIACSSL